MVTKYSKEAVLSVTNGYKTTGKFLVATLGNQIICYGNKKYKSMVFTETAGGRAYTQRVYNDLPKKYWHLFNIQPEINENGEIKYIAHCIEYGEKFVTSFYAPKGTSKAELLSIGQQEASEWGAECYKVTVA